MSTNFDSTLLQALATGDRNQMSALIPQVLAAQLGEDHPNIDLFNQYLALRQTEESKAGPDADETETGPGQHSAELERAQMRSARTNEAVQELRERIEKLYAELEILRQRNDSLAWAVGACTLCWGEDLQCTVCAGEGRPGFIEPDRELFIQLVAPAVRRFQEQRNAGRTVRAGKSLTIERRTK